MICPRLMLLCPMSFKDAIKADNDRIFLNLEEFAEKRKVQYDGETHDITLVMQKCKTERDTEKTSLQGIYDKLLTVHFSADNFIPEQGKLIEISDGEALGSIYMRRYRIVTSDVEMGIVRLELEAQDE